MFNDFVILGSADLQDLTSRIEFDGMLDEHQKVF